MSAGCEGAPSSAYVHIPFCLSKCHYCDFNSLPGREDLFARYVDALLREIESTRDSAEHAKPLRTVYFGGGTPTVLDSDDLVRVLQTLGDCFGTADGAEVTVEANPGTVSVDKLSGLRAAGFNRLSLGVQSFDDSFLTLLGRIHSATEAMQAFEDARAAGFDNLGIDLMFALPGQSPGHWRRTLDCGLQLRPEHVSLYELSVEEGTEFARLCMSGELGVPSEEDQLEMYEAAIETLTAAGYEHYEVSNFARPGFRSRHNAVYWRNEPCYGFGAGASSFVAGVRARRIDDASAYVESIERTRNAVESHEQLTGRAALGESVALGLRMLEGVDLADLSECTGMDVVSIFERELRLLSAEGLLVVDGDRVRVTHEGLLLLDTVAAEFVGAKQRGPED